MSSPSAQRVDPSTALGRWLGAAVAVMLLAVALVNPRTTIDHLGPFTVDELSDLVLGESDAPDGTGYIGSSSGMTADERRLGVVDVVSSVFSSFEYTQVPPNHFAAYRPGTTYVAASAYSFDSEASAAAFLEATRTSMSFLADERQRASDGSWLLFHPAHEYIPRATPVPVGAAGWRHGSVVLVLLDLGASSSSAALDLAVLWQERLEAAYGEGSR